MVWIDVYGKRYEGKSYRSLLQILGKDLITKWYDETTEKEKCAWCENNVNEILKIVPKEEGSKEHVVVNAYEHKACRKDGCPSKTLNPRSKEWLIKSRGMTQKEADDFSRSIGERSANTRITFLDGRNDNPFSKGYWVDRGLSEEEAQSKVNERNRRCKEFWMARAYPEDRAVNMALFHKRAISKEYLMFFKGYSEKDAKEILRINSEEASKRVKGNIASMMGLRKSSDAADAFFRKVFDVLSQLGIEETEVYTESFGKKIEWYCNKKGKGIFFYDFCVPSIGLVIEYHGTHVHPRTPCQEGWLQAYTKETAKEVFDRDSTKQQLILDMFGFDLYYAFYSDDDEQAFLHKLHQDIGKSLEVF